MKVSQSIQNRYSASEAGTAPLPHQNPLSGADIAASAANTLHEQLRPMPPKLQIAALRRSQSAPNIHISNYKAASAPDAENTLWKRDPASFNVVRTKLLRINNSFSEKFSKEPGGTVVDLSKGNNVNAKDCTQPTFLSCNVTSILTATNDLLKHGFDRGATMKDKFEYFIDNILTKSERMQVFDKNGFCLKDIANIANRTFDAFHCNWEATPYFTPDTPFDKFSSLLTSNKGNRFIVNFGAAFLYGIVGRAGHCAHIDKIKIDDNNQITVHLVESANYKYPENPWIPLPDLYKAMCKLGTDGNPRGFIILGQTSK
jgi:hypothetical protein